MSLAQAGQYDESRMSNRLREIRRLESIIAGVAGVGLNTALLLPYSGLMALVGSQMGVGVYEQRRAFFVGLLFGAIGYVNLTCLVLFSDSRYFRAVQSVLIPANLILAFAAAIGARVSMFPFGHPIGYLPPITLFTLNAIALYFCRPLGWR